MTPKEKAQELFDRFKEEMIENEAYFIDSAARSCALIAVDEILSIASHYLTIEYWNEVKQEIEKL